VLLIIKNALSLLYPVSNPVPDVAPSVPIPSTALKASPVSLASIHIALAASKIERTPSKKTDCVQSNKQILANDQDEKRKQIRARQVAERRVRAAADLANANAEAVRLEGQRVLKKAENMTKPRAESDFEDDVSMTGSEGTVSLTSPAADLPSSAADLLFKTYVEGERSAKVWDLRDNEEPDDEVKFGSGEDDDDDL
jgi:hypothetical protein